MIEFEDVRIAYKDKPVLDGVSLTIHDREFFVLIGSSGCGKTPLLKSINKLLPLRGGSLSIDGIPVEQIKVQDLPKKVGYVVQSGGLFPHLTVEENIALTMQIARFSKEAIRDEDGQSGPGNLPGPVPIPALRRSAAAGGHRPGFCRQSAHRPDG